MKKVAIVSAGTVPVPAVKGGAVEVLTTILIEENEKNPQFQIDVFTCDHADLEKIKYNYAKIIPTKKSWYDDGIFLVYKVINKLCRIGKIPLKLSLYCQKTSRTIDVNKYDYVIVENQMQLYKILNKKRKGKSKFVFHLHNSILGGAENISKYVYESSHSFIVVSEYIKKMVDENSSGSKAKVLYNCVDFEKFNELSIDNKESIRKKYGYKENDYIILYSGRFCKEKGIIELIEAFGEVKRNIPNCKLVIAGKIWFNSKAENAYYEKMLEKIQSFKEDVQFLGFVPNDEMPNIYNISNLTVMPSLWDEPFGLTALESLACNIPVVSSNQGGLVEVVTKGCGFNVETEKDFVENLAKSIEKIYRNKEKYNTREIVIEKFMNPSEYFAEFVELLKG